MNKFYLKLVILVSFALLLSGCSVGVMTTEGVVPMEEWERQQAEQQAKSRRDLYKNKIKYNPREYIYTANFKSSEKNDLGKIDYNSVDYSSFKEKESNQSSTLSTNSLVKYRRNSLYTLMIADTLSDYYYLTKYVFGNNKLSEKFNDHNIGPYQIPGKAGDPNQAQNIENFLNQNDVAKQMIAKWFNRGKDGSFNMKLVARRGEYNASDLDIKIALQTARGKAILKDAGEELIGNTFVVVYDYETIDNERKTAFLKYSLKSDITTKAYLYRLVWDDATADVFYNDYWMDKNNLDNTRKTAFDQSDIFKLKYIGSVTIEEDSNVGIVKHSKEKLKKLESGTIDFSEVGLGQDGTAIKNALNVCINELQRKYEEFRTKFPLYSGDPISAKVGKKEGIKEGDKFEVLEQVQLEDGTTEYHRLGIIKVGKEKDIWNNTVQGDWFGESDQVDYTVFQGPKGKYETGMLIRQIN